jgi:hypothetical protein
MADMPLILTHRWLGAIHDSFHAIELYDVILGIPD